MALSSSSSENARHILVRKAINYY